MGDHAALKTDIEPLLLVILGNTRRSLRRRCLYNRHSDWCCPLLLLTMALLNPPTEVITGQRRAVQTHALGCFVLRAVQVVVHPVLLSQRSSGTETLNAIACSLVFSLLSSPLSRVFLSSP